MSGGMLVHGGGFLSFWSRGRRCRGKMSCTLRCQQGWRLSYSKAGSGSGETRAHETRSAASGEG